MGKGIRSYFPARFTLVRATVGRIDERRSPRVSRPDAVPRTPWIRSISSRNRSSGTSRRRSGGNSPRSASTGSSAWNGASPPAIPIRSVPSRTREFPSRADSPRPVRIPPERDASPPTSTSVRSIPGTVIVLPVRVARA